MEGGWRGSGFTKEVYSCSNSVNSEIIPLSLMCEKIMKTEKKQLSNKDFGPKLT